MQVGCKQRSHECLSVVLYYPYSRAIKLEIHSSHVLKPAEPHIFGVEMHVGGAGSLQLHYGGY